MAVATGGSRAEETLAWEGANRSRAGSAALAAGLLLLATFAYNIVGFRDAPNVLLTDGLRDALGQPLASGDEGLLSESARWFDANAAEIIAVTVMASLGTILMAFVLGYLFRATQARRPELRRFVLYLALIGPVLYGIGPLVSAVTAVLGAGGYVADGRFSTLGAHDALRTGSGIAIAQGFVLLGQLATAGAILMLSLNAMRAGLLTRFMGILGCIVGALLILPFFGPPAIVQGFWLIMLGLLVLGRVRAVPAAWATGRAEPWPSQQVLRERKERAARGASAEADAAALRSDDTARDAGEPRGAEDAEHAFGGEQPAKRKRKRR